MNDLVIYLALGLDQPFSTGIITSLIIITQMIMNWFFKHKFPIIKLTFRIHYQFFVFVQPTFFNIILFEKFMKHSQFNFRNLILIHNLLLKIFLLFLCQQ